MGSNIEPEESISLALALLGERVRITGVSTFYRTRPEGRPDQPDFVNGVVEIETELSEVELREALHRIETALGRVRTEDKYASRTIDLDVLVREGSMDWDPQIAERGFVAIPLAELAPDLILPGTQTATRDIASGFAGEDMQPLMMYTEKLRKEATGEH